MIIQNNYGNEHSGTIIIAPISSAQKKMSFPTHVEVGCSKKMRPGSAVFLEQIRTIDKDRAGTYICTLNPEDMKRVDEAIKISLALNKEERSVKLNELQIFKNEQFGEMRMMLIGEEPWFIGKDVATALGYSNTRDALMAHVEEEDKNTVAIPDGNRGNPNQVMINESGLYALIFGSRLSNAKKFKHWVTSEVLPSIRKTGGYQKPMTPEEMMRVQLGMIDKHEERISKLENTMNIDYGQQKVLEREVAAVVIEALGGKDSNAYQEISKKVFSECNHDIKDYFNVNSRNNIPRLRFDDAVDYIRKWKPCSNTRMLIEEYNR